MIIKYKKSSYLNRTLAARADCLLNLSRLNPFEVQDNQDNYDIISDDEFQELSKNAILAYQAVCNSGIEASYKSLCTIHDFVKAHQFKLYQNQQFYHENFINGIKKYLKLEEHNSNLIKEAILILSNLWYQHSNSVTPLTDQSIALQLFEIFKQPNIDFHTDAILALSNFFLICSETKNLILQYVDEYGENIYSILRDFFILCEKNDHIEAGLKFLYILTKSELGNNWTEFLQFLPIFPKILNKSFTINQEKIYYILAIMLKHDNIFQYCQTFQLHSVLAECCRKDINLNQKYAYYLYKCVFLFVKRHYYRAFIHETIFNGMAAILFMDEKHDISSLFFTISLLIDNYCELFFEPKIHNCCIMYANKGCFENKLSASYCLCKFIYFSPDQKCDRLANKKGGLQIICDILECFDSKDIIFPLRAFQRLIELNQVLYCKMMNDFQIKDYLKNKYDEQMELSEKYPDDELYQDIIQLLQFVISNLEDSKTANDDE